MNIIKNIVAVWHIARWLCRQKRSMEADAQGYFTEDRAKDWRLQIEKMFYALEMGSGDNFDKLPAPVKWLLGVTSIDASLGMFGFWLLKSKKIEEGEQKTLNEPYRVH